MWNIRKIKLKVAPVIPVVKIVVVAVVVAVKVSYFRNNFHDNCLISKKRRVHFISKIINV